MKACLRPLATVLVWTISGCTPLVIISPYDAEIDRGLQDVRQKLNVLVIDAAGHMGTDAGTYDAYRKQYADVEVQLASLRSRAALEEMNDVDCKVPDALKKAFTTMFATMPQLPSTPRAHVTDVAVPNESAPAARGCLTILIDNAGAQLQSIEAIHAQPAQCGKVSCLPKDAVSGILSAANQSLDMALFVELYKKGAEET